MQDSEEKDNMVSITRTEALLGALARLNGWADPTSRAYRLRNPLMLKAFSPKHEKTEDGFRVFSSVPSGWDNALIDIKIKCSGESHSRLKTTDTLRDLVKYFGNDASATRSVKNFLRHALDNDEIYESTTLGWFVEQEEKIGE